MQKVEGKGQCKYINSDNGVTNDTRDQRCKSALREVRHKGQSMDGTRACSNPFHKLRHLLDLGRNPILYHYIESLLLEAATIKIVCAIKRLNTTPSTQQIQRTTNRVPLCELPGTSQRLRGATVEPQKRRKKDGERGR